MALSVIYPASVRMDVSGLQEVADDLARAFKDTGDSEYYGAMKAVLALMRAPKNMEEFAEAFSLYDDYEIGEFYEGN